MEAPLLNYILTPFHNKKNILENVAGTVAWFFGLAKHGLARLSLVSIPFSPITRAMLRP